MNVSQLAVLILGALVIAYLVRDRNHYRRSAAQWEELTRRWQVIAKGWEQVAGDARAAIEVLKGKEG